FVVVNLATDVGAFRVDGFDRPLALNEDEELPVPPQLQSLERSLLDGVDIHLPDQSKNLVVLPGINPTLRPVASWSWCADNSDSVRGSLLHRVGEVITRGGLRARFPDPHRSED